MQMVLTELNGLYGPAVLEDIGKTIRLYEFYDGKGQDWAVPSGLDYKPAKKRVNLVRKLIKREAGFMFGRTPEINLKSDISGGDYVTSAQSFCTYRRIVSWNSGAFMRSSRERVSALEI